MSKRQAKFTWTEDDVVFDDEEKPAAAEKELSKLVIKKLLKALKQLKQRK